MDKVKVSQDFLYEYLKAHDFNLRAFSVYTDITAATVNSCFLHHKDAHGRPRYFTSKALPKLNNSLGKIADAMRSSIITFGSSQTFTNLHGRTYDPGCMPAVKALSRFFNLTALCARVAGWSETKKNTTLSAPSSKVYGLISEDDVARLNAELLAVAGMLAGIEVTPATLSNKTEKAANDFSDADFDLYEEQLLNQES